MPSAAEPAVWWPSSVPPLNHPRHRELLIQWCLDQGLHQLRSFPVVQRHLVVVLLLTKHHLEGCLQSTRITYSKMRAELAPTQAPETIAAALRATATVGEEYALALNFIQEMWEVHTA